MEEIEELNKLELIGTEQFLNALLAVLIAVIGVGIIVRCLVLKQPDCMSLIVEASKSIFARDGPALLKAVTT